jgi:K+-transporting ATPase ATPase A chain
VTAHAWTVLLAYSAVLVALAWPLARWIDTAMDGRIGWAARIERPLLRAAGVPADAEMGWLPYTIGLLVFNGIGVLFVYLLQRLQGALPLNPHGFAAVSPDSAFNTATSFVTNTNWQGYGGEATMSYLTQMLALAVQNFVSAATGIAVVVALVRGFARASAQDIGNVWTDLLRATLWVLLPISFMLALFFVGQGVVQSFDAYQEARTLEVVKYQAAKTRDDGKPVVDAKGQPVMEAMPALGAPTWSCSIWTCRMATA